MNGCELKQTNGQETPDSFGRQFFFRLAMVTNTVAAWSAVTKPLVYFSKILLHTVQSKTTLRKTSQI